MARMWLLVTVLGTGVVAACGGGSDAADVRDTLDTDGAEPDVEATTDTSDVAAPDDGADALESVETVEEVEDTEVEDSGADDGEEGVTEDFSGIPCGADLCVDELICCWQLGTPATPTCMANDACEALGIGALTLRCDGPEDCPHGETCCVVRGDDDLGETYCADTDACVAACHRPYHCSPDDSCCPYSFDGLPMSVGRCYPGGVCPPTETW